MPRSRVAGVVIASWPAEMRSETAAAYCDEPSVEAFLARSSKTSLVSPPASVAAFRNGLGRSSTQISPVGMA